LSCEHQFLPWANEHDDSTHDDCKQQVINRLIFVAFVLGRLFSRWDASLQYWLETLLFLGQAPLEIGWWKIACRIDTFSISQKPIVFKNDTKKFIDWNKFLRQRVEQEH
jgi:hypothetical protein